MSTTDDKTTADLTPEVRAVIDALLEVVSIPRPSYGAGEGNFAEYAVAAGDRLMYATVILTDIARSGRVQLSHAELLQKWAAESQISYKRAGDEDPE